jgi:hypothetical protein
MGLHCLLSYRYLFCFACVLESLELIYRILVRLASDLQDFFCFHSKLRKTLKNIPEDLDKIDGIAQGKKQNQRNCLTASRFGVY